MEEIYTNKAPKSEKPLSQAIKLDDIVYVSGQVGKKPSGEMANDTLEGECRQVMENLKNVIEAAGGRLENVAKTLCFLEEKEYSKKFNEIYSEYFTNHNPARSCISGVELSGECRVEVEAILHLGNIEI